jgi:large subunit ribosomal protein L25
MKQRIDLTVTARETGKHHSRAIRNERKVPAVIYGAIKNANVVIDENAILKYNTRAFENALFNLKSDDKALNGKVVLMKSVDVHPLSRRPVHADFFALDMSKTVRVNVEIKLEGKPVGLAEGGLLNVVHRQVEVECLPTEIPDFFTVDVSHLGVGEALHVSDLKIPSGIKVLTRPEDTIAGVVTQAEEVVAPVVEAAAAAPAAAAAGAKPAAGGKAPAAAAAAPAAGKAAPAKPAAKK